MKLKINQKYSFFVYCIIILLSISLNASNLLAQYKFQGRVFWVSKQSDVGNWTKATAITGVTVTLYGSMEPNSLGQKITSQKTNSSGYYELSFQGGFEMYTIVESQPSGYTSLDATSPGGSKINNNKIKYTTEIEPIGDQNLTGNIFWEKPEGSSNNPPNAVNDNVTTAKNTAVKIKVLGNDSDPDGDAISLQSVASPGHGTTVKSGNQVRYTPASGFTGTDNFNYTISDGKGGTDQAKVTVTVRGSTSDDCEIRGMKFNDSNNNGQRDTGESGLPGWTIYLDANTNGTLDTGEKNITTVADGSYSFTELSAGTYTVAEVQKTDWIQTVPQNPDDYYELILSSGQVVQDIDFGNYYSGAQEYDYGDAPSPYPDAWHTPGTIWFGDGNDYPDTESGTQTDSHALGDDNDGRDDENGFMNYQILSGKKSYVQFLIYVSVPTEFKVSGWIDCNQDGDWDDPDEEMFDIITSLGSGLWSSMVSYIVMAPGTLPGNTIFRLRISTDTSIPASPSGYGGPGEVCDHELMIKTEGEPIPEGGEVFGYKWNDMNGNGLWDSDESGLPNWTIWLDANQNGVEDAGDQYTQTDAAGYFIFTGLPDGTYKVGEEQKPGWSQIYTTNSVTVKKGEISIGIYFGNREEEAPQYDYGDAPSSYPQASHTIGGGTWFGGLNDAPDTESAYISHPHALEDDVSGDRDDEDGLISSNFIAGQKSGFRFSYVFGDTCDHSMTFCIDLDRDGKWTGWWKEKFHLYHLALPPYPPVNTPLPVQVVWNKPPASTPSGPTYFRMRIVKGWLSGGLQEYGHQETGEVEDHEVMIKSSGDPEPPGGLIWGYKYEDLNGNGAWDTTTEPALPSWTVWLDEDNDGIPDHFTTTNASGEFRFTGLADGTYTVGEVQQPGWVRTWPPDPGTHSVTVNTSQDFRLIPALLFGNQHTGEEGEGAIKWRQQPLLYPGENDTIFYRGWRETSLYGDTLIADDWFCYDPRPVTRIHWWGVYADWDSLFLPPVTPHQFHISIWTDVPGEEAEGWSHPGVLLREYRVNRSEVYESWDEFCYSPDSAKKAVSCFKYTYYIPPADWFYQEGDSTVYWLSIAAVYEERPDSLVWGWLTREHYFHDDAVRIYDPEEPNPGDEFREGEPLTDFCDMSFVLGTDEIQGDFDFGDAPHEGYGTTILWNGAQHLKNPSVYLGQVWDDDYDGQPNLGAQGDDDDGLDDENGISFSGDLVREEPSELSVQSSGSGFLNAWIDFNGDGDWRDDGEQVFTLRELTGGMQVLEFTVPDQAVEGLTYARFRFSTEPASAFCGFMMDGEVEDYQVYIGYGTKVLDQPHNHIPDQFCLHPNYPNPFNPSTTITFEIPAAVQVRLVVYNVCGQEIAQLIDRRMEAGRYSVQWDGRDKYGRTVSTGVYLCRLITDQFSDTVKLLLMK
ncbi:MAG: GEVED domain-containing protein [bacterium]